jgi:hypothetical protein
LGDVKSDLYVFFPGGVRADEGYFKVEPDEIEFFTTQSAESIFYRIVKNIEDKKLQEQPQPSDQEDESDQQEKKEDGTPEEKNGQPGEPGEPGSQEDIDSSDEPGQLKPGDIIYDNESGEYGVVLNVDGETLDYDPISEEEARKRLKK